MIPAFLAEFDLTPGEIERIAYLVGHHHHPESIDDLDYQILIEADYLVNADEAGYELNVIVALANSFFERRRGKQILKEMYFKEGAQ